MRFPVSDALHLDALEDESLTKDEEFLGWFTELLLYFEVGELEGTE